eukprot:UN00612
MQKADNTKINSSILKYITAVDDLSLFQNIMTRRNIELEEEARKYLSEQNVSKTKPVDINNMTEQEQIECALSESTIVQQQPPQQIMQSLPNYKQYDIVPSAPFSSSATQSPEKNIEVNDKNPKRISLKPLKLQKDDNDNLTFEGIKNDQDLPILTAESIHNIKLKQSSKYNESVL